MPNEVSRAAYSQRATEYIRGSRSSTMSRAWVQLPLREFSRVLKPGGALLVGFFEGREVEQFAHAVTAAYRWPVDAFDAELDRAGFDVLDSHVRKTVNERPVAVVSARRRGAR